MADFIRHGIKIKEKVYASTSVFAVLIVLRTRSNLLDQTSDLQNCCGYLEDLLAGIRAFKAFQLQKVVIPILTWFLIPYRT
jgi:hypothetical protein